MNAHSPLVPNLISAARIAGAPFLVVLGLAGRHHGFLILFAALLASDYLDGTLARRLDAQSRLGSQLDTWGDALMYFCLVGGAWFLWPDLLRQEILFFVIGIVVVILSGLLCIARHRRLPTYHTWSSKLSTATLGLSLLLMFGGVSVWFFRIAVAILVLSAVEGSAITMALPRWRPDVSSLRAALRERRAQGS